MKTLIVLSLFMTGCNMKWIYASDRYIDKIIDICDGDVKSFQPRNGEVVCKEK